MFRNPYDFDVTIWSPQGRLHQVEYALEAVKQGAPTIGIKCANFAVLVSFKRTSIDLALFQKKIVEVDPYVGISFSGLTCDAKLLANFLRTECLSYRYGYNRCIPLDHLVQRLGKKMHMATQRYNTRPYGVGILIAGCDELGPHIYECSPSGNFFDCKAIAIGGRCQSARTYLEKHLTEFPLCDHEETIKHGLKALQSTLPCDAILTQINVAIGLVGRNHRLQILDDDEVSNYLTSI
ncbi:hypothetical protein RI129_010768 [Pyrocoelia pectoralis]|uniref:Proteasome subunit alpha type n=1 Tax=Pyrocoelia pectoralis TaxID=417401 RepID=A0AAN7V2L5_9COLE